MAFPGKFLCLLSATPPPSPELAAPPPEPPGTAPLPLASPFHDPPAPPPIAVNDEKTLLPPLGPLLG